MRRFELDAETPHILKVGSDAMWKACAGLGLLRLIHQELTVVRGPTEEQSN